MRYLFFALSVFLFSCNSSADKKTNKSNTSDSLNTKKADPSINVDANFEKAAALLQENKAEEAKEIYMLLSGQNERKDEALIGLGSSFLLLQEPEKALESFQQALELKPNYFPALLGTGSSCLTLGKFEQAKEYFNLAKANDATVPDSYWGLAIAYDGLNQKDSALFYAKYFMDIDPNSPYIYDMQKIIKKHAKK